MPSARRSGRALLVYKTCFPRLLSGALISSGRPSSRFRARNQAIVKPQSVEVFDGLGSPSQGLFLGLLKKLGALSVQFLDALNCCFVCHPIFPVAKWRTPARRSQGIPDACPGHYNKPVSSPDKTIEMEAGGNPSRWAW
jgi:hypothetical protein